MIRTTLLRKPEMEQKTEASQAVDDLDALASRLSRIHDACLDNRPKQAVGEMICAAQNMPEWNRVRAALKAQSAPTEAAQGEDSARLDATGLLMDAEITQIANEHDDRDFGLQAHSFARAIEAKIRASAETGGVKS